MEPNQISNLVFVIDRKMPNQKNIRQRIIMDCRFDSISGYVGQGLGPLLGTGACQISQLFVLKLSNEHRFSMGQEDHLRILYSTELPAGEITLLENKVKTRDRSVHVGFSQTQFNTSGGDAIAFTINVIADVLAQLVGKDNAATTAIGAVKAELLKDREQAIVRMLNLYTESNGYRIEPYLKLNTNSLLFVNVTELKTGRSGMRLFLEGSDREVFRLVKSLSIKGNNLVAEPSKTSVVDKTTIMDYEWRGFTLPVQANLEDIFSTQAFPRTRDKIDG